MTKYNPQELEHPILYPLIPFQYVALERKESRGLHFNKDYPQMDKRFNQATKLINNDEDFIMRLVTKV